VSDQSNVERTLDKLHANAGADALRVANETVTLNNAANDYTGNTTISSGTLILAANYTISSGQTFTRAEIATLVTRFIEIFF